jgi:hypothetical protein
VGRDFLRIESSFGIYHQVSIFTQHQKSCTLTAIIKPLEMGLFNLFNKKDNRQDQTQSQPNLLKLQGPKYLRKNLAPPTSDIAGKVKITLPGVQWIGQLISTAQNRRFQIKYYGDLKNRETITDTGKAVQRIIAVDPDSNEEIVLFDKMYHGWDGFISNIYEDQKNVNRNPSNLYQSKNGAYNFRILVIAYYNDGTKQELVESSTHDRQFELENGVTLDLQDAFDDSFDGITIFAIDDEGNKFELVDEELA